MEDDGPYCSADCRHEGMTYTCPSCDAAVDLEDFSCDCGLPVRREVDGQTALGSTVIMRKEQPASMREAAMLMRRLWYVRATKDDSYEPSWKSRRRS